MRSTLYQLLRSKFSQKILVVVLAICFVVHSSTAKRPTTYSKATNASESHERAAKTDRSRIFFITWSSKDEPEFNQTILVGKNYTYYVIVENTTHINMEVLASSVQCVGKIRFHTDFKYIEGGGNCKKTLEFKWKTEGTGALETLELIIKDQALNDDELKYLPILFFENNYGAHMIVYLDFTIPKRNIGVDYHALRFEFPCRPNFLRGPNGEHIFKFAIEAIDFDPESDCWIEFGIINAQMYTPPTTTSKVSTSTSTLTQSTIQLSSTEPIQQSTRAQGTRSTLRSRTHSTHSTLSSKVQDIRSTLRSRSNGTQSTLRLKAQGSPSTLSTRAQSTRSTLSSKAQDTQSTIQRTVVDWHIQWCGIGFLVAFVMILIVLIAVLVYYCMIKLRRQANNDSSEPDEFGAAYQLPPVIESSTVQK